MSLCTLVISSIRSIVAHSKISYIYSVCSVVFRLLFSYHFRVMKVAKKFDGKMNFAVAAKEDFGNQLEEMGINENSEDLNVVIWDAAGHKYRLDPATTFSMEVLEKFVQEFLDKKLEPYLKSEDIPADNSGPVKVRAGYNLPKNITSIFSDANF